MWPNTRHQDVAKFVHVVVVVVVLFIMCSDRALRYNITAVVRGKKGKSQPLHVQHSRQTRQPALHVQHSPRLRQRRHQTRGTRVNTVTFSDL